MSENAVTIHALSTLSHPSIHISCPAYYLKRAFYFFARVFGLLREGVERIWNVISALSIETRICSLAGASRGCLMPCQAR